MPGVQEVWGNLIPRNRPDLHWNQPPLGEMGQKPGEIIAFTMSSFQGPQNHSGPAWDPQTLCGWPEASAGWNGGERAKVNLREL